MAIYYDKSKKKYKVDVWHNGSRWKQKGGFRIKALAEKFERECLNEIDKIKLTGVEYKELTYSEIFQEWKVNATNRKRAPSLIKDEQMHRDYIDPFIGHLKTKEINSLHFDEVISSALKNKLSKSSVNKIIQHFKAVFNHAHVHERIPRNPAKAVKQLAFQDTEMDYYFAEELDEFLAYTNQKYQGRERLYFLFGITLFLTGVRLGEALGLKWGSIDFTRDQINIHQSWSTSEKKLIDETKSKKERVIPLPSYLKSELINYRNSKAGSRLNEFVFSFLGDIPIDASNFRNRHWNKDAEEAGLRRIRIHDARHTYATLFRLNGGGLYDLKELLGHASIKTTEKYLHFAPDHLSKVKDIIPLNYQQKAEVIKIESHSLPNHSRSENEYQNSYVCS